jgi:SAM-dependent methyltransferase
MLAELARLVRSRSPISPSLYEAPALRETAFPDDLDTDAPLEPAHVEAVKAAAAGAGVEVDGLLVSYEPGWTTQRPGEQVDAIFSQAVLEHVDDLPAVYRAMYEWVKPDGCVSHEIDFTSHGFARAWNGHWTFSDREWRLVRGRRRWAINREPLSTHLTLLEGTGFVVVDVQKGPGPALDRRLLAPRFQNLDDSDLRTASAFILARKA